MFNANFSSISAKYLDSSRVRGQIKLKTITSVFSVSPLRTYNIKEKEERLVSSKNNVFNTVLITMFKLDFYTI
jgi:hypothetical protein